MCFSFRAHSGWDLPDGYFGRQALLAEPGVGIAVLSVESQPFIHRTELVRIQYGLPHGGSP